MAKKKKKNGNILAVSKKAKPTPTIWPSHSNLMCLLKRNGSICPHRKLYTIALSSLICHSYKPEQLKHPSKCEWANCDMSMPWNSSQQDRGQKCQSMLKRGQTLK
jgi:hypothetical protein